MILLKSGDPNTIGDNFVPSKRCVIARVLVSGEEA